MLETEDDFEQEIREGLRVREAPAGFADRVMARASEMQASANEASGPGHVAGPRANLVRRGLSALDPVAVRWAVAAALLLAAGLGGYVEQQRQIAGEHARDQVYLALRITSSTLQAVHNKVAGDGR